MRKTVAELGLDRVGIASAEEIFYNLSYEELFLHETDSSREGLERGVVTSSGAVAVDSGRFTGRSPKDKYVVDEPSSRDRIWWADGTTAASDNQRLSLEAWAHLKEIAVRRLTGKRLYVMDGFCGAVAGSRLRVRVVTEIPWMAHFVKNMFLRPTTEDLESFQPDFIVLNACKAVCPDHERWGMRSEVFAAFHLGEDLAVIGGTWYSGEIKKGIFTVMNDRLPMRGVGSFHCSANMGEAGDTALFFGLSGTGKTTLSADPRRLLIGDDEHGWDDEGIFNLEGGCYAKCVHLSEDKEPEIFRAIRRNALLENVAVLSSGEVDFDDTSKTENTRVSYPIEHIERIVRPVSRGGHPKTVIFLTCDAYGVLPPVARLNDRQALYHFLSGYTAKVAGTELGVTEPRAAFSACFGQAFLPLHPTVYAEILGRKMAEHGTTAYLVNTGWVGGTYGVGHRIPLPQTRAIVTAILEGTIDWTDARRLEIFDLEMPKAVPGVPDAVLDPQANWSDKEAYRETARRLAGMFQEHYRSFMDTEFGRRLAEAGPRP